AIVSRAIGDHEVCVVENEHEPGLVALGRHVALAGRVGGGEENERRGRDERARVLVERRLALEHGALVRLSVERAPLLFRAHGVREQGPTSGGEDSTPHTTADSPPSKLMAVPVM